jgi:hypothetical protein
MTNPSPVGRPVPVSLRAMMQRLNRKLEEEGKALKSPRGSAERSELGDHFVIDTRRNVVVAVKLTEEKLEAMARKLGVLAQWEEVER